jgi:hypothetical protein
MLPLYTHIHAYYIPENRTLHYHHCEHFRSYLVKFVDPFLFWLKLDTNNRDYMKTYIHFSTHIQCNSLNIYQCKKIFHAVHFLHKSCDFRGNKPFCCILSSHHLPKTMQFEGKGLKTNATQIHLQSPVNEVK